MDVAQDLLRFDRDGDTVDPSMNNLKLFSCSGEPDDRTCDFSGTDDSDNTSYVEGLLIYSVLNFVAIGLLLFCCPCLTVFAWCRRYHRNDEKTETDLKDSEGEEEEPLDSSTQEKKPKKSASETCKRLPLYCLSFSLLSLLVLMTLALVANFTFAQESGQAYTVGEGAMQLIRGTEGAISQFLQRSTAEVLTPSLSAIRTLINEQANFTEIAIRMEAINLTVAGIPENQDIISLLRTMSNFSDSNVTRDIDLLRQDIVLLDSQRLQLYNLSLDVDAVLVDLTPTLARLQTVIEQADETIDDLVSFQLFLTGSPDSTTDGVLGEVSADLLLLRREENGGTIPSAGAFQQVVTTGYGSLPRLISAAMNGDPAESEVLATRLWDLTLGLQGLPNLTATAVSVRALDRRIERDVVQEDSTFRRFLNSTVELQTVFDDLPTVQSLRSLFDEFVLLIEAISLDSVLRNLEALSSSVPFFRGYLNQLQGEFESFLDFSDVLVDLAALQEQLQRINSSIATLPTEVSDIQSVYDSVNDTITEGLVIVAEVQRELQDGNETLLGIELDLVGYMNQTQELSQELEEQRSVDELTTLNSSLVLLEENIGLINTTALTLQATLLSSTLTNLQVDLEPLAEQLVELQSRVDEALRLLVRTSNPVDGDYVVLSQGVCDVGGGPCREQGVFRCSQFLPGTSNIRTCTRDSTCASAGAGFCLADDSRAQTLQAYLAPFAVPGDVIEVDDFLTDSAELSDMVDAFELEETVSALDDIMETLTTLDMDVLREQLASLQTSLLDIDLDSILSALTVGTETLDSVDYEEYIGILLDVDESVEEVRGDSVPLINTWQPFFRLLDDFLRDRTGAGSSARQTLSSFLLLLSPEALDQTYIERGPGAMLLQIVDSLDEMADFIASGQTAVEFDPPRVADFVRGYARVLDRMNGIFNGTRGALLSHGSLHYMASVVGGTSSSVLPANFPLVSGIFVDSQGNTYPDDATCWLDQCVEHSTDFLNHEPLSMQPEEFPGFLSNPVELSLQQLLLLIWVPVMLVILFGIVTLCCQGAEFYLQDRKDHSGASWAFHGSQCMAVWMYVVVLLMMLVSALVFPLMVLWSDSCTSGGGLGEQFLVSYGDALCTREWSSSFEAEGSLSSCAIRYNVTEDLGGGNVTLQIDMLSTYREFVRGECTEEEQGLGHIMRQIGRELQSIPSRFVEQQLADPDIPALGETLQQISRGAAAMQGRLAREFFEGEAEERFDCSQVGVVFGDFSGYSCEDLYPAVFYVIGCLYLAAWVLLCCGLPGACCFHPLRKKEKPFNPVIVFVPTEPVDEYQRAIDRRVKPEISRERPSFTEHSERRVAVREGGPEGDSKEDEHTLGHEVESFHSAHSELSAPEPVPSNTKA